MLGTEGDSIVIVELIVAVMELMAVLVELVTVLVVRNTLHRT